MRPDWVTHYFHHLITALRLPPIRLHDLRHAAATNMLPPSREAAVDCLKVATEALADKVPGIATGAPRGLVLL